MRAAMSLVFSGTDFAVVNVDPRDVTPVQSVHRPPTDLRRLVGRFLIGFIQVESFLGVDLIKLFSLDFYFDLFIFFHFFFFLLFFCLILLHY